MPRNPGGPETTDWVRDAVFYQIFPDRFARSLTVPKPSGLDEWGVSPAQRDRLLGIIEQRCLLHRNGASWQVDTLHGLEAQGQDRQQALHEMLRRYLPLMHENIPVHEWPGVK